MNDRIMPGTVRRYSAWSGVAIAAGGILTILINAGLTPFLRPDAPYTETAASSLFLWRQGLSALAAALLLAGSTGLHQHQAGRSGRFGAVSFVLAFLGCGILFAHEWGQVFFVRDLALRAPEALQAMESAEGPSLFDIGAMIAVITFTVGWIAFSISMLLAGVYPHRGPILLIAGFLAVPLLGAALPGVWGPVLGNIPLGLGWILLGRKLYVT
jgi:hypothetical protein